MAIRTLIYDMGNVLIGFSHERMYQQIGAVCGRTGDQVREFLASGLMLDAEEGRIDDDRFHREFERWAERPIEPEALRRAGSDIFWPNYDIWPVVEQLNRKGYRLVLLSNTSRTHIEFVRSRWPWLEMFDDQILSFEVGATKPKRRIYEAALDRIQCAPNECFYTDDIAEYVQAGRDLGLTAEVFTGVDAHVLHLKRLGVAIETTISPGTHT